VALYDTIGRGYQRFRHEDPRIAGLILRELEGAWRIVNVGAGAGSYEPRDRALVAVEPSRVMIQQRRSPAPVVRASASELPFPARSFDASLAVLTIHHWPELGRGLRELRRVTRGRVVILTHDPAAGRFWLCDYFPEILDGNRWSLPSMDALCEHLGALRVIDVPVPHDCLDGFLGAYWRRPHEYLRPEVRSAISLFSELPNAESGLAALQADLESGAWEHRHRDLLEREHLDLGYRLVVA